MDRPAAGAAESPSGKLNTLQCWPPTPPPLTPSIGLGCGTTGPRVSKQGGSGKEGTGYPGRSWGLGHSAWVSTWGSCPLPLLPSESSGKWMPSQGLMTPCISQWGSGGNLKHDPGSGCLWKRRTDSTGQVEMGRTRTARTDFNA